MTTFDRSRAPLLQNFTGRLLTPADAGYDASRRVFNAAIDRHPRLVAQCLSVPDVVAALAYAQARGWPVSVRCGGHGVHGGAIVDGGVVIDLRSMKEMRIDREARTIWAQSGLTWGELYRATDAFQLSTTGGAVGSVGIGGFSQGSGNGWLMRLHGFTIDNVLALQVVTAAGAVLTASPQQHADLFWAIRGGVGNFGIVTAFEYRLHPVPARILAGTTIYPADVSHEFLAHYREFFRTASDATTAVVTLATMPNDSTLPARVRGKFALAVTQAHIGPAEEGEAALQALRSFGRPLVDGIGPTDFLEFLTSLDATASEGLHNYWQGRYLRELGDDAVSVLVREAQRSPNTVTQIQRLGGGIDRVPDDSAAFCREGVAFLLGLPTLWTDPAETARHQERTREFADAMRPFTARVCLNHVSDVSDAQMLEAFGPVKYERLRRIKARHDSGNLFRSNLNIPPL